MTLQTADAEVKGPHMALEPQGALGLRGKSTPYFKGFPTTCSVQTNNCRHFTEDEDQLCSQTLRENEAMTCTDLEDTSVLTSD